MNDQKLIVRLSGKGQYEITTNEKTLLIRLNEIDNEIVALLAQTEIKLQTLLAQMASEVTKAGTPLEDNLTTSHLMLPPTDLTLAEAVELFAGEGIIVG